MIEPGLKSMLEELYRNMTNEDLIKSTTIAKESYQPETIELMLRELERRNISQIKKEEQKTHIEKQKKNYGMGIKEEQKTHIEKQKKNYGMGIIDKLILTLNKGVIMRTLAYLFVIFYRGVTKIISFIKRQFISININYVIIASSIVIAAFILAWNFRFDVNAFNRSVLIKTDRWTGKIYVIDYSGNKIILKQVQVQVIE